MTEASASVCLIRYTGFAPYGWSYLHQNVSLTSLAKIGHATPPHRTNGNPQKLHAA